MIEGPGERIPGGSLSGDDAARLVEPIARITASGLPLAPGLRAAAREMPIGPVRRTLGSIAEAVERGASLDDAVKAQGARFPEHLSGLLLIGRKSGHLSETLTKFLGFMNVGEEIRRGLTVSLIYPIVAVVLAIGIFVFVCVTLVSSFEAIFRDFGVSLPALTILLIEVSHVFEKSWRALLEAVIGATILWLVLRFVLRKSVRRSLASGIPVIGSVWRNTSLAEFCHLLALLIESDLPLEESLRLAGIGVADARFERAGRGMAGDVASGLSLSQAVLRQRVFPRGLTRLLRWAEGHQSLPEALTMAGQMFEARARSQSTFAGALLSVLTVLVLLLGISAVILGVFLPMITLISRLSG
ncbi:MAG: type II secretion system F family protein [Isosphaeraceae bacterium]